MEFGKGYDEFRIKLLKIGFTEDQIYNIALQIETATTEDDVHFIIDQMKQIKKSLGWKSGALIFSPQNPSI